MPGNTEEKEKCLEKLTKMQKFIPFLDFMIDKIKKKNNELSLDCQLSKFQVLRSMISEKNGKYNWDNIIKVEDVIEKLIAKLDFKDQYENPKENLDKKDSQNYKTSMATSVSIVPSSTVTTTTSQPKESKPQEFSSNTVDLIMKTLKMSVKSAAKQNTDRLSNPLEPNQSVDTRKTMETDLDKDLDVFDLTEYSNLSEADTSQCAAGPFNEVPDKLSSHDDLLSSSREKLLKSLQSRLFPCKTNRLSSQFSDTSDKAQKSSDSQNSSAFGRSQINFGEQKNKVDSESSEQKAIDKHNRKLLEAPGKTLAKQGILKSVTPSEKTRTDPASSSSDVNLKQKLKEKFSTDICEVYRVPGKSVGGSLRSLKDSKDHRKSFNAEENDLSKPGKVLQKGSSSLISHTSLLHPKKDNESDKSRRDSSKSDKSNEKTTYKHNSEKNEKRSSSKNSTPSRDDSKSRSQKSESGKSDKAPEKKSDGKNAKDGKKIEKKNLESDKLNDEELLGFVKENIQSLPHLSKLKPSELRKVVQSSLSHSFSQLDSDGVSEISDDSFQDLDDEIILVQKSKISADTQGRKQEPQHSLAALKIAQVGPDGVAKNVKPIVEPTKDTKILDEIGDKTDDLDDVSYKDNLDEEDYAIQLIEETTPDTYSNKKKKGLLELPMPITNDLFDYTSSCETFDPSDDSPPAESRDLRLKKLSVSSEGKNSSCNKAESNPDLNKTVGSHNSNIPKDSSHLSKSQTGFGCVSTSLDKAQRRNQERSDPRLNKSVSSHIPQEGTQHPQLGNRHPNESTECTFRNSSSYSKPSGNTSRDPRHHSFSSEPKSYAEYKRLKRKEQDKLQQLSKESLKNTSDSSTSFEPSRLPTDKEDPDRHAKKIQDSWHKGQTNLTSHTSARIHEGRKNSSNPTNQRRYSDHSESRSREEKKTHHEETRKEESKKDEKRHSLDSEELVSPLEELYRNENKPKTGRGYGIQNFKIPKKVPQGSTKPSQIPSLKSGTKPQSDTENAKKNVETKDSDKNETSHLQSTKVEDHPKSDVNQADATVGEHKTHKTEFTTKTDSSITKNEISNEKATTKKLENSTVPANCRTPRKLDKTEEAAEVRPGTDSHKTDSVLEVENAELKVQGIANSKDVESSKKCEAQIIECDSSIESSSLHETSFKAESATSGDKTTIVQKEEITQEFVEALIRKSFQSGEGKLLLAQVKLFEEFTRKLSSKKRKTIQKIQKIINSESESSSSEASFEDKKKKKRTKKADPKIKRQKKRGKKVNKHKFSSSSSLSSCSYSSSRSYSLSSESEKSSTEEIEGKRRPKRAVKVDEAKVKESSPLPKTRTQRKQRDLKLEKQFVGGRSKRQKIQNKLLEQILNEPQEERDNSNSFTKDFEPAKKKTKSRGKTELDRLHDDIRSMFISDGVLTATGHRMCRMLKRSGGNMNNLDIVKESAKMVEEETLKRRRTRRCRRNSSTAESDSRSRSQSLDKGTKARENDEEDLKLTLEPRVVLQRVDLDNFGYGVKVSEECVSFRRMQGRNTAIKGMSSVVMRKTKSYISATDSPAANSPATDSLGIDYIATDSQGIDSQGSDSLARKVFLLRNKRKFERLRDSHRKKSYHRKKLMEVVKNLPLKMAKMKHLQIFEKKEDGEAVKKKKSFPENVTETVPQEQEKVEMSNSELLNYAFEEKRKVYSCKLCPFSTKSITGHYKAAHPRHEVLISRLCLSEAEQAKKESEKFNYDLKAEDKKSQSSESAKRKAKKFRHPNKYNCRMCPLTKVADINTFASHLSSHTGEFRFQCPAEGCVVHVFSQEQVKFHILTKHSKSRYEFYNKIKELYPLVVENGIMFGFLCSQCHYVQIGRKNLEKHMLRQHENNGEIIKINMSSEKVKKKTRKTKNRTKEESVCGNNREEEVKECGDGTGKVEEVKQENQEVQGATSKSEDVESVGKKRKHKSSSEGESDVEFVESKKILLDKKAEVKEESKKPEVAEKCDVRLDEDDMEKENEDDVDDGEDDDGADNDGGGDDDDNDNDDDDDDEDKDDDDDDDDDDDEVENTEDNLCGDMEDCVDLKNISDLKGNDIIESAENLKMKKIPVQNTSETVEKLKVGPLEAVLLKNSEVLYECFIKGCLFSTRVFNLFEKHIKISHRKTKWDGICEICGNKKDKPPKENSFQLLTALKHLKLHERERTCNGKFSKEDLIMELKLLNTSGECIVNDEESDSPEDEPKTYSEPKQDEQSQEKTDSETPFPPKPLLRVRNLLGDRLSTPKPDENEVVAINEEESNSTEPPADSMFTIENVRSLTEETPTDENELKIEKVCSMNNNLILKPPSQLSSGKTIIVRSCPTRKIAIRPEPSALSVDVGQISVVQPPVVAHPVVLSPISTTSPIRIISTTLSPKPQYTVKPVVLAADRHLSNTNVVPVVRPSLTPTVAATTIMPAGNNAETIAAPSKPGSHENKSTEMENISSNPPPDVEIIPASGSKSPSVHLLPRSPSSDLEEEDEEAISPQRFFPGSNTGKKSVKDARIYHEMLTKTKLCHLFKCMGIECSFTCSNENVFTQHIGLHEAQRRLKKNKSLKTIVLKSANKKTRAFYWQQCAYCCEVLTSSNKALGHHIYYEHGHCMYQCGFCFYRAICQSYVEIHQNLAHSQVLKTTPRIIYKCKPLKMPPSQAAAMEKHGKKQSVRPYQCDQCGKKFLITHEFTKHLATQHQSVTAYTCHICKNLCFKVNRLINHYKMHSYSTYQCAYCLHGTETEKEMVFHLCNFHFSQPAVMYVRALAEGQSDDERQKANKKKKKHLSNQLDSLKVIIYESDIGSSDCILEEESEEISESASETSLDLSAIVAELGIYTGSQSTSTGVTPLMKELASIGDKTNKHLSLKNLLPNAQFSSENECVTENCSVLISSGLSIPSDPNNEREMNIPLGQLPLETVNVQHKKTPPPLSSSAGSPDRNLNIKEINLVNLVNLQSKDKTVASTEEEKVSQSSTVVVSSAVHKLPPVVLGRSCTMKNAYPSKNVVAKKKSEESMQSSENKKSNKEERKPSLDEKPQNMPKEENTSRKPLTENSQETKSTNKPLITNIVSLSNDKYEEKSSSAIDESIVISDVCSLSSLSFNPQNSSEVVLNVKSKGNSSPALKPPIIRVEDFHIGEENSKPKETSIVFEHKDSARNAAENDSRTSEENRPSSPDIIILEDDKGNDIETVILDSDDEKDENGKNKKEVVLKSVKKLSSPENETIRKEMEVLRNQIENETNSLLLEEMQIEDETEIQTGAGTKVQTEAEKGVQTEAEKGVQTEAETRVQTEAETRVQTEAETRVQTEAETRVQTEAETRVQTEAVTKVRKEEETEVRKEEETEVRKEEETEVRKEEETEVRKEEETGMRKEEETEVRKEEETEVRKEEKTEVRKEEKTEVQKEEKTEVQKEAGTKVQKEGRTEVEKKAATEVQKEAETEVQEKPATEVQKEEEMELEQKAGTKVETEAGKDMQSEVETEGKKPMRDLTLDLKSKKNEEVQNSKVLLSPIEEAICSLNKKLESETKEVKEKTDDKEKKEVVESPKEADVRTSDRRRTRFGARENKKDDKNKKFKVELTGKELFICGNEKCTFAGDDDSILKDHLFVCDLSRESSVLVCPHCFRQIKQFHPYLEHLKYHGVKKHHCGLCDFSSAVDASVSRHVKQKHKCTVIKVLPKEGKEGHLVYYPKNYKVEKIDFEVNGYSPGDEDKLPLQSVYQVNVKCAKCPYFTKVRSNMVRHLKIHVKSVETEGVVVVPSTAPTNPVPCLETKERMFDKMTNLAASSQLAQAKEKTALESLSPEEEAKLPQFVAEQMRYKCCLPDCNYITVDDGMLKHHIKALHDEINYYSCPHCRATVHVDVRHVTLDKIGFHLKHHDSKLYKCVHCIFFHYQKGVVEKHTVEKHPERRYFVHTVREPKLESATEDEPSSSEGGARVWKCGLCDDCQTPSKSTLMDHLLRSHNTKSKYKCQLCPMKGNTYQVISNHFASKHIGEKVSYLKMYYSDKVSGTLESGNSSGADSSNEHFDTTPLWQRGAPRVRHIRGILIEEEEIKTKKSKKGIPDETEAETSDAGKVKENAFYCPLCTNKKKPFYTRNEDCFRTHLYQELNYQQFACILCGKMFVDRKDFDKHHAKAHADKPQALKQTKEDHEIKFWVDQVIAKRKTQMEERKRKLSDSEGTGSQEPPKKKKEG